MSPHLSLGDEHLPAAFQSADHASGENQKLAARLVRLQLLCLIVAALGGALDLKVSGDRINLGGLLSVAGFAGAIGLMLYAHASDADGRWYRARAGAESAKTLAWRYAVGGEPFGITKADATVRSTYVERLMRVLAEVKPQDWQGSTVGPQITIAMESLRSRQLPERRSAYLRDRIGVQRVWYSSRSHDALVSAKSWTFVGIVAGSLGVLAGLLRMLTVIDIDILGVLATVATATSAWSQFRQHRMLAASYAVADQELGAIEVAGPTITSENDWEVFVRDAEDAISREHTLWLARRGASPPA